MQGTSTQQRKSSISDAGLAALGPSRKQHLKGRVQKWVAIDCRLQACVDTDSVSARTYDDAEVAH